MSASATGDHWVHDLDPYLLRFGENAGIGWYGTAYVAGFLVAGFLLWLYHKHQRSPFNLDAIIDLMTAIVIGVLAGGRIGYCLFYQPSLFTQFEATELFGISLPMWGPLAVWEGGMASHGGFIGVALALWYFASRQKTSLLQLGDLAATVAPPGIFFGRIANFINGELWGHPSQVPWAVVFPEAPKVVDPQTGILTHLPRHPSQLYEALAEGLILGIYIQLRFWLHKPGQLPPGQLVGEFLIIYATGRIICELYREPDADLILGVSRGIFYSLFLIPLGAWVIYIAHRRKRINAYRYG